MGPDGRYLSVFPLSEFFLDLAPPVGLRRLAHNAPDVISNHRRITCCDRDSAGACARRWRGTVREI